MYPGISSELALFFNFFSCLCKSQFCYFLLNIHDFYSTFISRFLPFFPFLLFIFLVVLFSSFIFYFFYFFFHSFFKFYCYFSCVLCVGHFFSYRKTLLHFLIFCFLYFYIFASFIIDQTFVH